MLSDVSRLGEAITTSKQIHYNNLVFSCPVSAGVSLPSLLSLLFLVILYIYESFQLQHLQTCSVQRSRRAAGRRWSRSVAIHCSSELAEKYQVVSLNKKIHLNHHYIKQTKTQNPPIITFNDCCVRMLEC